MRDGMRSGRQEKLAALAARQHGVVSLAQAEATGLSRTDLFRRVQAGHLRRIFPRVYRFPGARPSLEQRAMAAVLWAGPDSVASHDTAAALWDLEPPGSPAHVTVPTKPGAAPRGIQTHVGSIQKRDRGTLRGVPLTAPARTLLDLASARPPEMLVPVVERAVLEGVVTVGQLRDAVGRNPRRRGSRRLRDALGPAASSALERRIDAILRTARLPPFVREHEVGPYRLDFAWPDRRVGLEADGRRWHSSAPDFERDRTKHNFLVDLGWQVWRVTWRDLDGPARWLTSLEKRLYGQVGDSQHAAYRATPTGSW